MPTTPRSRPRRSATGASTSPRRPSTARVCLRVCFVNFRTRPEDVDFALETLRELGRALRLAVSRSGIRLMPLKKFDCRRSGVPASSKLATRLTISVEHDLDLEPREVRAGAEVGAAGPERHLRVRVAADVERVRGSSKTSSSKLPEMYQVASLSFSRIVLPPSSTSQVAVRRKWCTGVAQRRISFGGRREQLGLVAQALQLVRVLDQRQHALGDRVAGGLVAGDREQQEVDVVLVLGQRAAVDLGLDELRDDVVARALAPLVGELAAVLEHLQRRRVGERQVAVGLGDLGVDRELGVVLAEHPVAELDQVAVVGLRRAEHLGEDPHRQLRGDVVDELDLALLQRLVEHPVEELADALGEHAHGARGEVAVDDRPQRVVGRGVHVEHRLARLELLGLEVLRARCRRARRRTCASPWRRR